MNSETSNLSKQIHDVEGFEYMNLKFPILFDKNLNKYAIYFNNSETKLIGEQSFEEKKRNCKLLQTFDNVGECASYWDKTTINYFGGSL